MMTKPKALPNQTTKKTPVTKTALEIKTMGGEFQIKAPDGAYCKTNDFATALKFVIAKVQEENKHG